MEIEEFRKSLHSTIEGVAEAAAKAVREHIVKHAEKGRGSTMTHESWLEAGTGFVNEGECVFCGQPLDDRTLVDSYAEFFGDAYKTLAADVKVTRQTFARYEKVNTAAVLKKSCNRMRGCISIGTKRGKSRDRSWTVSMGRSTAWKWRRACLIPCSSKSREA